MKNAKLWTQSKISYDPATGRAKPLGVDRRSRFNVELYLPHYVRAIKNHAAGRLLDCGAGNVPYYEVYKPLVKEAQAVDWNASPHAGQHLDKSADLNKAIPYPDKSFDSVLLADVLEHLYAPAHLLSEVQRVLKPGGKLICFVPFMYWLHETPHDYHRYSRFMLEKLCHDAGLKILELKPYGGGPDVLLDVANKLAKSRFMSSLVYRPSRLLSRRRFYKRLRNRTQQKMPLGYVLVAGR